ncbi:hypothetical protein C7974DRAFT_360584 [Boeremia exigua]|uniref:uncharacterized protein n=1 Tax=Boeremia exigua TaxID=749465 RepID=UPI001E8E493F|nr:uncharacterized protein C7974DRAFT_360584 [Boeremia exigua]KAH6625412.1 hypothetical protein C7974DRAFT_360584 [Boeremia exigua]
MAPQGVIPPPYEGPRALGFSKYADPPQRMALFSAAAAVPVSTSPTPDNAIATKQQIAASQSAHRVAPAAELAVDQGTALKKEVEAHTAKFSQTISSAIVNTRELLSLLRESTPGSEAVDNLWKELEQLFKAANNSNAALPEFMKKQRDNLSLYHSSMMNETIRDTQEELRFQHKKVNTQHDLILEQQDAFQNYKAQNASKLQELENVQERVSRLTLEKGNFRTEVEKYKELLEQEKTKKAENLKAANALQKEFEASASSAKQLQAENDTLRKTTTEALEQLKTTELKVTERFAKELAAKSEELQKESAKLTSLNALINTMKSSEAATKKDLEKIKNEHRLLSVKYNNQTTEHAAAFQKANDQTKMIEALTADVDRLQKQNTDLQSKAKNAAELAKTNDELSNAKKAMGQQLDSLTVQLNHAKEDMTAAQDEVQKLQVEVASKVAAPVPATDEDLLQQVKALEEQKITLEGTLAEWTQLAKRSYKEYKEMVPKCQEADKLRLDAQEKEEQIIALKAQLASAKGSKPNGVGAAAPSAAGGDAAYWKEKYERLLSEL